jgi:hypothetical protein
VVARLPGFTWKDLGPDGGPFDQRDKVKVLVHTTEGNTLAGAEEAFKRYPPHLGYDPVRRIRRQYVSLDRHSYSIKNSEAEDDYVIQVEIVGRAHQTHQWSDTIYQNFAIDVILPLESTLGVPRRHLRFYRDDEGIVLARPTSPVRLSAAAWRNYTGWLGHQHAPAPDEHWDPGGFLMDKAFSYVPGKIAEKEDVSVKLFRERDKPEVWVGDYLQRRWVSTAEELGHLESVFGKVAVIDPGTASVFGEETAESKARRTGTGGPLLGEPK